MTSNSVRRMAAALGVAAGIACVGLAIYTQTNVPATAAATGSDIMVTVRVIGPDGQLTGPVEVPRVQYNEIEWKRRLTPEQYAVVRSKGTERPFCGTLLDNKKQGYYACVACNLPLFHSGAKFDSGTGWPSFFQPVAKENILEDRDVSHGMVRVEIMCKRCEGHLGHVFEDGPKPTGLRFCLNSESLRFVDDADVKTLAEQVPAQGAEAKSAEAKPVDTPKAVTRLPLPANDTPKADAPGEAKAVFGGGCFWCTEAIFDGLDGVKDVVSGYSGGEASTANYKAVCDGDTGHAEAIQITYDPSKVTFGHLLRIFMGTHNPTQLNAQGPDHGTQYRSAIFYADDKQKEVAEGYFKQLSETKLFGGKAIVTTLEPLKAFYPAEEYHQDYVKNNPNQAYVRAWVPEKIKKRDELLSEAK